MRCRLYSKHSQLEESAQKCQPGCEGGILSKLEEDNVLDVLRSWRKETGGRAYALQLGSVSNL